ncbi:MAG: hypothetical protein GXP27_06530 [Planctomycetes bacterium]|nr:hypothetical protein [Planctomycetota bacterium]
MVTAGGRLLYIIDEGPISSVYLPPQWKLVARDAFSGVLLWERPIENWEAHLRGFRSGPPEVARRLVAAGERVYVALNYGDPVTVLDAATGETVTRLAGTEGARELLWDGETLFVLADDMTAEQHRQRRQAINRDFLSASLELSIWRRLPRKAYPIYGRQRIVAVRTDDRRRARRSVSGAAVGSSSGDGGYVLLWAKPFRTPGDVLPATLAVDNGKVCFQIVSHVVCLDALTGKELWRAAHPVARSRFSWSTPTLVMHDGVVLVLDRKAGDNVGKAPPNGTTEWIVASGGRNNRQDAELVAYSMDTGAELLACAVLGKLQHAGRYFRDQRRSVGGQPASRQRPRVHRRTGFENRSSGRCRRKKVGGITGVIGARRLCVGCWWAEAVCSSSIRKAAMLSRTRGTAERVNMGSCRPTDCSTCRSIPARASRRNS